MTFLSLRFAARELRAGVRGFRIFLLCLALGVAAIAAASSTAEAFRRGLGSEAREILGGDLSVSAWQRRFTAQERTVFAHEGQTAYAIGVNAMAEAPSGARHVVELRGVSDAYPLAGKVDLQSGGALAKALTPQNGVASAVVEQSLLDRLGLKLGDKFLIGNTTVVARDVLLSEPDRLGRGFPLGPRVLTRIGVLEQGGFLGTGAPYGETVRIAIAPNQDATKAARDLRHALRKNHLRVRDRNDAAPGIRKLIDQLEYFLGFIGLASLVAGGLGVSGAVSAYLEARKPSIAVLKALGADGALTRNTYLIQIGLLAVLGVAIGLAVGAAVPLILGALVRNSLPIPALFAVYPMPLLKAAAFGLLSAAAFSLAPLARARTTPPAALLRRNLSGRLSFGVELIGALLAGAALAGLAVVTAPTPLAAGIMIGGVAVSFVLLWLLGLAAAFVAGRLRVGARGALRIGLANLAGPRSAARTASPAIGLGVALLAAVVLIQSSLLSQVADVAPRTAPALVFIGVPGDRAAAFDAEVTQAFGAPLRPQVYQRWPYLTGRIVRANGKALDRRTMPQNERWAFDNDIGLSAIGAEPPHAGIVAGHWWAANYAGPPLVALDADAARAGGLKIGDTVTLAILGREIDARIAVLRKVEFGAFGPSFTLIVTPQTLAGAGLNDIAIAKATPAQEAAVTRALGRDFPTVDVISVREQLAAASDLFNRLALAVRGAAAVAALAGLLVLAGAIAAGARARAKEAATLKVLGAARGQILMAYAVEYGFVGLIAGVAGTGLGYLAAWPVVVKVFEARWSVDWTGVAALVGGAALLAGAGGILAALQALSKRPAPVLRAE
ncbi:MAG TPA: FtsX-like permease family protein [Caulobacteraceae bacterium]|jgi:putative ABC transport system permease protein